MKEAYISHGYDFPKHLYKYTKIYDSTFEDIEQNMIHVSNPKVFDDKVDAYFLDIHPGNILDYVDKFKSLPPEEYEELNDIINRIYKENLSSSNIIHIVNNFIEKYHLTEYNSHDLSVEIQLIIQQAKIEALLEWKHCRENTFIYCLTDNYNYEHMWKNFSGFDGICIEYDFSETEPLKNEYCISTFPVQYVNEVFGLSFPYPKDIFMFLYFYSTLIKLNDFKHEKEWRYIVEYAEKPTDFNNKVKYQKISGIYLGKDISQDNKEKFMELCEENNINLYQINEDNTINKFL